LVKTSKSLVALKHGGKIVYGLSLNRRHSVPKKMALGDMPEGNDSNVKV
jgi:hypothetical protein